MKKRLFMALAVLFLSVLSVRPVLAADGVPRIIDDADLLSDSEETALVSNLDEISERQQVDVAVITVDSLEGESVVEYADYLYDYYGYGFGEEGDGILFLISMEEREWYISTGGYGIIAVTDAGREYMAGQFADDLSQGNYLEAFTTYAELCDAFITQAATGEPYDVGNFPQEPFEVGLHVIISLCIGFVISLIVTGVMKSGLKSVESQSAADNYLKQGSMKLTRSNDMFLYKHVDRKEKQKEEKSGGSETHVSASGKTHGGGGGKF